ncbi:MAG: polysaccharide deacetylase family protein [Bacteroidetes bacterium]|nr:polysaccharide deacetylase family protein [Bacteroidota bacterium]
MLVIKSKTISPRLQYITLQLFEKWHGITVDFVEHIHSSPHEYSIYNKQGLLLSNSKSGILFSEKIDPQFFFDWDKIISKDFNSDWLGASFYLLSRMEEYGAEKDVHGRFPYNNSVAFQRGFLKEPLVEQLVYHFIEKNFPQKTAYIHKVNIVPTLDIDMTHAYLGRNIFRQLGAFIKDFLKGNLSERLNVLRGKAKDPFDNFDYQLAVIEKSGLILQYFFQVGDYGKYDKNISPKHPLFKQVIAKLHKQKLGLHPSYNSMIQNALIAIEKEILQKISDRKITVSRQHFLRFSLPTTYRALIKAGIKEEHSMGYSETTGFRAGTSRSFYWFDVENNCVTELLIQPFVVMDVALQYYQKFYPEQAISEICEFKQKIAKVNGSFAFCFHNESLSERKQWKGWRTVFEEACKS